MYADVRFRADFRCCLPEYMRKLFAACTVTAGEICTPSDGGAVEGTVTVTNVKAGYYDGLSDAAKSAIQKDITKDISKKVFSLCPYLPARA